jgi:glycosyltransferase involved in cell wall biosynthesis
VKRRIRIACLAHGIGGRGSGVRRLVLDQAKAWGRRDSEVNVGVFVRCETGSEVDWRGQPHVVAVTSSRLGMVGRFVARELLSLRVALWRPDVIYLRHTTVSPSLLMLAALFPTIVGGDLDDLDEYRIRSPLRYWYARLTRDRLLRRARRVIVVTAELARHPELKRLNRPTSVLPNSIDVADYPELPAPYNAEPRLVFIASPRMAWSGVDKVARLAAHFPTWRIDVVGPDRDEFADPPPNLHIHGFLQRDEYLPLMAAADVAIGPLALHRKGLCEASALKIAEYLAYGIPVIMAHRETAFPAGAPFLLQLPNREDGVDASVARIEAFVTQWKGRRIERSAVAPIDASVVEAERLQMVIAEAAARKVYSLGEPTH